MTFCEKEKDRSPRRFDESRHRVGWQDRAVSQTATLQLSWVSQANKYGRKLNEWSELKT